MNADLKNYEELLWMVGVISAFCTVGTTMLPVINLLLGGLALFCLSAAFGINIFRQHKLDN